MRKSSLILLLAVAFVLATAAASFSAGDSIVECDNWSYGLEISTSLPASGACPTFDYEYGSAQSTRCTGGYCPGQNVKGIIMRLCACDAITDLTAPELDDLNANGGFWLRFTITSPATGVYWTNQNFGSAPVGAPYMLGQNIAFSSYPDTSAAYCYGPNPGTQLSYANTAPVGQDLWDWNTHCSETDCCFTCDNEKVTQITTNPSDVLVLADLPVLVIDIPTMVWDASLINAGDKVTIHVELLGDCGVVCQEGKVYCEGDVEIGTFTDCKNFPCNVCLPYIVGSGYGEGSWSGIALTNSNSKDSTSIITIHDGDVVISEEFAVAANSVKAILMSDFADFDELPEGSRAYATVQSEVPTTAFVMLSLNGNLQGYFGFVKAWGDVVTDTGNPDISGIFLGSCIESDICSFCGPIGAGINCVQGLVKP